MIDKPAVTEANIAENLKNRWSPRAFDINKPVSDELLTSVLEAARWAPSCMNEQPWRFVVCDKQRDETAWQALLACLAEKNQQWASHAPVLILSVAMNRFAHHDKDNRWAAYDTGAASLSLCLQATSLGLVTHQMGGFDSDQCRQRFDLPDASTPMAVIALGYQAEPDHLNAEFKDKESAPRSRATLAERVYFGSWPC